MTKKVNEIPLLVSYRFHGTLIVGYVVFTKSKGYKAVKEWAQYTLRLKDVRYYATALLLAVEG